MCIDKGLSDMKITRDGISEGTGQRVLRQSNQMEPQDRVRSGRQPGRESTQSTRGEGAARQDTDRLQAEGLTGEKASAVPEAGSLQEAQAGSYDRRPALEVAILLWR